MSKRNVIINVSIEVIRGNAHRKAAIAFLEEHHNVTKNYFNTVYYAVKSGDITKYKKDENIVTEFLNYASEWEENSDEPTDIIDLS